MSEKGPMLPLRPPDDDELQAVTAEAEVEEAVDAQPEAAAPVPAAAASVEPLSVSDLERLAQVVQATVPFYQQVIAAVTSLLSNAHFIAFPSPLGETVFHVRTMGAERILSFLGVDVYVDSFDRAPLEEAVDACPRCAGEVVVCKKCGHEFQTRSAHYMVTATGRIVLPSGKTRPVYGFASSKMAFFARSRGEDVPPSRIQTENIYKAARSDLIRQALRSLGFQRLSAEDLRRAGLDPEKIARVDFGQAKPQR